MWSTIGAARRNRGEQGFTLIEMMIVVAIIGVLASAAIPAFLRYMASARDVEGTHNTRKIGAAARAYFEAHSKLPADWCSGTSCSGHGFGPNYSAIDACKNHAGIFPESSKAIFKTTPIWQNVMFSPEGNTRFYYYLHTHTVGPHLMSGLPPSWNSVYAMRYTKCGTTNRYVRYTVYFLENAGALELVGPHEEAFEW